MTKLLFIEASPRGDTSHSSRAARVFLDELRRRDQALQVDHLALWREPLPEFDGAALAAKYARIAGQGLDSREAQAWAVIEAMVARLARADRVLIATPMWNFGVPYKLKHWLDLVTQPGLTFAFSVAEGYRPLLAPRPTLVVLASSGDYADGPSRGRPDLATPYLRAALGFIGLVEPQFVPVAPTIGPDEAIRFGLERARRALATIAADQAAETAS